MKGAVKVESSTAAGGFEHHQRYHSLDSLRAAMLLLGISQPFLGVHFTLAGALRGAGDTVTPLWSATLGNWVFRVPLALLVAIVGALSLVGDVQDITAIT